MQGGQQERKEYNQGQAGGQAGRLGKCSENILILSWFSRTASSEVEKEEKIQKPFSPFAFKYKPKEVSPN